MLNNIINKIRSILKPSDRENIKDVLEDLIEDNGNGTEKIDDGTKNIFKNVINLHNKCIEDVMIPRADIDAVSIETTLNDLVNFIDKTKHSRIPVFENNLDKDDILFENVIIDKVSLEIISGSVIDFKKEMIGESFVINNPKASASCGCGLSFSV